jgi:hypothetical protein
MSLHSGRTDRRSLDLQGDVGSDRVWDMPFPLIPLLAGAVLGKKASKKKKPEDKDSSFKIYSHFEGWN